jgi:peptide/nickel transport system substrate-binding protein
MRTNPKTKNLLSKSLFFMLLVIVVLISGCSNSNISNSTARANNTANNEAAQGSEAQDKTVTVAISSDAGIDRLDAGAYDGSMNVHAMIYEGLVEYREKGEILPSLAESWDISEDGKVYTFHLRHDVKFSDGTEFNADAVKFSFERWIKDPANSLNVATAMQSLVVVDEHTITMTFNKAYYPFLTELSFARPVRIISPSAVEPAGDITGKFIKAIGTGAWMAELQNRSGSHTRQKSEVLGRNAEAVENYFEGNPRSTVQSTSAASWRH